MNTNAIYAVRDRDVVRYDIIAEDEKTYSLRDTSCRNHDNCEIRISREELDKSGRYKVGKDVEFLNDSALRYDFFHIGLTFFLNENDAKIEVETEYIKACKDMLDNEIMIRDGMSKAITDLTEYLKNIPDYTEDSEISYGSHIYTYSVDKLFNESCKVYHGHTFSVEETLGNVIYDLVINDVSEITRTKNGVTTNAIKMYVDNRPDEDSTNAYDIYLEVEELKGKIILSCMTFCEYAYEDEIQYCRGAGLSFEGYKTRYECEKLVINEILNKYNSRMSSTLKSIKNYETYLNEHINKLNELK